MAKELQPVEELVESVECMVSITDVVDGVGQKNRLFNCIKSLVVLTAPSFKSFPTNNNQSPK